MGFANKHIFTLIVILITLSFFTNNYLKYYDDGKQIHQLIVKETSIPKNRIFFLKTHKCASSTIQNILLRFGHQRNLDILLPSKHNYIGNPKPFQIDMVSKDFLTTDGKYDLFVHHTRYSQHVKSVMRPNTMFVTILREPSTLFESIYSFYHFDKKYHVNLSNVIGDPSILMNSTRYGHKLGINQMNWDLGMNPEHFENVEMINNYIEMVDRDFDLIMLFEHMEASLVLLAHLMQWPLEWVAYIPLNTRNKIFKKKLTEFDRVRLNQINKADYMLYNHFKDKFKTKIKEYGVDKMKKHIGELIGINQGIMDRCVLAKTDKGYGRTISYELKNNDTFCQYYVILELKYTSLLRSIQYNRLNKIEALEKLLNES
ncbi:galactosylceramide sulfotransferase-like [Adelges cooleyi]|uniref:galactosylceramide sulfotransferase-like n=1 Tax=Adelges cooleyi TaxID=133065 RepID=UPI00217F98CE|nr:galactosylceramide sulfotransferase-like [Adelges cooleyi]